MMFRLSLFLILTTSFLCPLQAQQKAGIVNNAVNASTQGMDKHSPSERNVAPRVIKFEPGTVTTSAFMGNINTYLHVSDEIFTFKHIESNTDRIGMKHHLMQQYFNGIPLEGMWYRIHEKNGFVTSANGKAVKEVYADLQADITEEEAFNLAAKYLKTKDTVFRSARKLIVSKDFTFTPESFALAYQFDLEVSLIEQWRISIDAKTGEVLNKVSLVHNCFGDHDHAPPPPYITGTGLTNYYGNQTIRVEQQGSGSRLVGQTQNGGIIGTYDFRNVNIISLLWFYQWHQVYDITSSSSTYDREDQRTGVSVHWAAEQAFEYYFTKHDRNSFDNLGSRIKSYVRVHQQMDNAFWLGEHNLMVFGDGSNNNPPVELDVVSHELTHGVTQYEAKLQYSYEPGALNESFSDIFAKAVEFHTFGDTATWQVAKYFRQGGLRDFSNPNAKGQPDTYVGDLWFKGYEDNGGVHYNSGVQNFWFYLLCNGGSGINDLGISYDVQAIGMDHAVDVAYRNLTEYLGPFSDYLDSRIGSLLAAADLYGDSSPIYEQVVNAWEAVGVILEPIITSAELYDITATTVKIKGSLLPRGDNVTYHFEYGTTPSLGTSSEIYNYEGEVQGILRGLQSNTKYYFRLIATNENGVFFLNREFTTLTLTPLVKIREIVDYTETGATCYGQINPNSLATTFHFEYGLTPALGFSTPKYPLSDTTEYLDASAAITNLEPRKKYYYRLVATNEFASASTSQLSFFTAVKPKIISFDPPQGSIGTEVTVHGQNFNADGGKNAVFFGATRAPVLSASPTELKVTVPVGASLAPISISDLESGLSTESLPAFVPTFSGGYKNGDLQLRVGISDIPIYRTLVHDMDGDGKPDLVATHAQGFSVFQNVNQGGPITEESFFRTTQPIPDYNSGYMELVDLDGNGLKDVVLHYNFGIRIYPNLSVPGFTFFGVPVEIPLNFSPVFADFDQDGRIDMAGIAFGGGAGSRLIVMRNQKTTEWLSAENFGDTYETQLPYWVPFLNISDLNRDGLPDILVGASDVGLLIWMENKGNPGHLDFEQRTVSDATRGRFARYISQDLNQNERNDVVSFSPYSAGTVSIFENRGTTPDISLGLPTVLIAERVSTHTQPCDINGDGKVDLLTAFGNRQFVILENKTEAGQELLDTSFEKISEYGMALENVGSGSVDTHVVINDLNGDGRPEVINSHSYNYGPNDGFRVEIWQHAPNDCVDPSMINVEASRSTALIILPANSTFDEFEIYYAPYNASYWWQAGSTTLFNLTPGNGYKLRVRAKCYLYFSEYHYYDFVTECLDLSSFRITNIQSTSVTIGANNLTSFEVQYSVSGKDEWVERPPYSNQTSDQINGLLPGTTYEVRFRGRCAALADYKYQQFTTLCPAPSSVTVTELSYDKALLGAISIDGDLIIEYSHNNMEWTLVDQTREVGSLIPGKKYFVRASLSCTDITSDFSYGSFTTPCPKISSLHVDGVTPFGASVTWSDDSKTGTYILDYHLTKGGTRILAETNSAEFQLKGLNPGTNYTVGIAPQCIGAKEFTYKTFKTVCYAPTDLYAHQVTQTTADLSWIDTFAGGSHNVRYSIRGSNVWATLKSPFTSLALKDLRPGSVYEVRVSIDCPDETAPYASILFETELYDQTRVAPNPTDSKLTIYPSKNLIGNRFSIFDGTGKLLLSGELRDYMIDLSGYSSGIYVLKIEGETPLRITRY